ncbi:MAG TPA: GNAT family N-acetyltransferase [Thermoanaerobaculia bacterium]|nr:GNAT family N-acetyltransferase [Thermoanaerobaculia bacterium]
MIRTVRPDDSPAVADLIVQLGYDITPDDARRRLVQIAGRADHALLVAEDANRVVGFIHVSIAETLEHEPRGEIRTLTVDESCRGREVGARLLEAVEEWARSRGMRKMRVRSNMKRERARRFYERHGYEVTKSQNVFDKNLGREGDR